MQKQRCIDLRHEAARVGKAYSKPSREKNVAQETFRVADIIVLSEVTAGVVYNKEPTKKKALAFFYWLNTSKNAGWHHVFVSYQHLSGMDRLADMLHEIEQHNFWENFRDGG